MNAILIAHIFCCWFMTGLIWLVQILVYPIFKLVGSKEFSLIHEFHTQRITWIVAPIMSLELITAGLLFYKFNNQILLWNLVMVLSLWVFTGLLNVPTHNKLKYESEASKFNLINYNWPRTMIWTLRSFFLFSLVIKPVGEML